MWWGGAKQRGSVPLAGGGVCVRVCVIHYTISTAGWKKWCVVVVGGSRNGSSF